MSRFFIFAGGFRVEDCQRRALDRLISELYLAGEPVVLTAGADGIESLAATWAAYHGFDVVTALPTDAHSGTQLPGKHDVMTAEQFQAALEIAQQFVPNVERRSLAVQRRLANIVRMLAMAPEGSRVFLFPAPEELDDQNSRCAFVAKVAAAFGLHTEVFVGEYPDGEPVFEPVERVYEVGPAVGVPATLKLAACNVAEATTDEEAMTMANILNDQELLAATALAQMEQQGTEFAIIGGAIILRRDIVQAQRADGSDALMIRRGSLSETSVRIANGVVPDLQQLARLLYREFVDSRAELRSMEAVGLVGISCPAAGLKGLTAEQLARIDRDHAAVREIVVEVGVPVETLKAMAAVHGYMTVTDFVEAVNQDKIAVLLSRTPSTSGHRTYLRVHLRRMGFTAGPLFVAPSTMKALFGDQDGDTVFLYLPMALPKERWSTIVEADMPMLNERPKAVGVGLPAVEPAFDLGLAAIAKGRFLPNLFEGMRALVGANAKTLVGHWMVMVNAATEAIAQLVSPSHALRFYDLAAPMTEEIMDAGKESSGGDGDIKQGLPFGPAIARVTDARNLHDLAELLREVADGVDAFFGPKKAQVAADMREAAEIVELAARAHDAIARQQVVEAGATDIRVLPVGFSVSGYLRHLLPDPEALERSFTEPVTAGWMSLPKPKVTENKKTGDLLDIAGGDMTIALRIVQAMRTTPDSRIVVAPKCAYPPLGLTTLPIEDTSGYVMEPLVPEQIVGELSTDGSEWMDAETFVATHFDPESGGQALQLALERLPDGKFRMVLLGAVVYRFGRQLQTMVAALYATPEFRVSNTLPDGRALAIVFDNGRLLRAIVEPSVFGVEIVDAMARLEAHMAASVNGSVNRSSLRGRVSGSLWPGHAIQIAQALRNAVNDLFSRHGVLLSNGEHSEMFYRQTIEVSAVWLQSIDHGGVAISTPDGGTVKFRVPTDLDYEAVTNALRSLLPSNALIAPMKKGADVVFLGDLGRDDVVEALGGGTVLQNFRRIAREAIPDKAVTVVLPDGTRTKRVRVRAVIGSIDEFTGAHGDSTEGIALFGMPGKLEIHRTVLVSEREFGIELRKALRGLRGFQLRSVFGDPVLGVAITDDTTPEELFEAGVDITRLEAQVTADAKIVSYEIGVVAVTDRIQCVKTYVTPGMVKGMATVIDQKMEFEAPDGSRHPVQMIVGAEAIRSKTSVATVLFGLARFFGADVDAIERRLRDAWAMDQDREHKAFLTQVQQEAKFLLEHIRQAHPGWVVGGDVLPAPIYVNGELVGDGLVVDVDIVFDDTTDLTYGSLPTVEPVGLAGRDIFLLEAMAKEGVLHPALPRDFKYPYRANQAELARLTAIRHIIQQVRNRRSGGGPDGGGTPVEPEPPTPPAAPRQEATSKELAAALIDSVAAMLPNAAANDDGNQEGEEKMERVAYFDGAASGNPGPAGCAFVLVENGQIVRQGSKHYPSATNNEMEWRGALAAVRMARHLGWTRFRLVGDSQLVVNQIKGAYKVKEQAFKPLKAEMDRLLAGLDVEVVWMPREQNKLANDLAQAASKGQERAAMEQRPNTTAPQMALIAGTRQPTEEQRDACRALAKELASSGVVVLAGGADGIDTEAVTAAVEAGGEALSILPWARQHNLPGKVEVQPPVDDEARQVVLEVHPNPAALNETVIRLHVRNLRMLQRLMAVRQARQQAGLDVSRCIVYAIPAFRDGKPTGGTMMTMLLAKRLGLPCLYYVPGDGWKRWS